MRTFQKSSKLDNVCYDVRTASPGRSEPYAGEWH